MLKNQGPEIQAGSQSKEEKYELSAQAILLRNALKMVLESKIRPEMNAYEWFKVLFFMHAKGMLYVKPDENGDIDILVGGYRIPEPDQKYLYTIPEEEEGDYFFINFYLPIEKNLPISAVKNFVRYNNIKGIVRQFEDDSIKVYNIRRKSDVKQEENRCEATEVRRRRSSEGRSKQTQRAVSTTDSR